MTNAELIHMIQEARENAHSAGRSSRIAFAAGRRLQELLEELKRRGIELTLAEIEFLQLSESSF